MRFLQIIVLMILISLTPAASYVTAQNRTTYDDVVRGMKCFQNSLANLECEYTVGKSLKFGIVAPGKDASIYIYKSDYDGDYYAIVGVAHGCVIVNPGSAAEGGLAQRRGFDLAFVSPRNGKVYRKWQDCGAAK